MVSGGKTPRRGARARRAELPGASALLQRGADSTHPSSRLLVWHSRWSHAASRHDELLRGHALNQQLELCLPGAAGATAAQTLRWETGFYYEVRASVAMFLSPAFLQDYVLGGGATYMIAKNVAVDSTQSVMLLPSGELLLLVDADTYAKLGLVGEQYGHAVPRTCQSAHKRSAQRYVISLDLKSPVFSSQGEGRNGSESAQAMRIRAALSDKLQDVEMLICAYNERGAARTILFGDDDTVPRKRVELNADTSAFKDVFLPRFDAFYAELGARERVEGAENGDDGDTLRTSLLEAYEWLGLVACRLPELLQRQMPEEYVSTFTGVPGSFECQPEQELSAVRWRGLLASEFCTGIVEKLQRSVKKGELPWAAVMVWGFPDAFVSWEQPVRGSHKRKHKNKNTQEDEASVPLARRREHGYLGNGSNHYTLLLLPDDEYFLLQALGPHDATA